MHTYAALHMTTFDINFDAMKHGIHHSHVAPTAIKISYKIVLRLVIHYVESVLILNLEAQ